MSPILFSLYLNDLENYLKSNNCNGVFMDVNDFDNFCEIVMYFVCLLFADNTAHIATNAPDLQHSLDVFYQYSNKWKLKIKVNKTKI